MTDGAPFAFSPHKATDILLRKPFSTEELLRTVAGVLSEGEAETTPLATCPGFA